MNKQKLTYLSPETETLVVRFEDSILQANSPLLNVVYGTEYMPREDDGDVDLL